MQGVTLIDHPILQARVTQLRDKSTPSAQFAEHLRQIAALLLFEMTRTLPLESVQVETPLTTTTGARLAKPLILVPILRAGLGMVDGMARMLPDAAIGHIGMYRNEETLEPQHYYFRLPSSIAVGEVLLVDPMLATGNSAVAAIHLLKKQGATSIRFGCLISCPEGLAHLTTEHPDVPIFTGAIDEGLNEKGYIVPGLGDAGDRYFGTF
ncbi:MAG TPA: uracil phosphoribosyltransferase [Chthoniobacterales bacterium]|jgi:uracil phosphoribosyltransferase